MSGGQRRGQPTGGAGLYSPTSYNTSGGEFAYSFGGTDDQNFESFDYSAPPASAPVATAPPVGYYDPHASSSSQGFGAGAQPTYFIPSHTPATGSVGPTEFDANFEDEPPLLEELGINPYHIMEKTRSVLNPMRHTDASILQDTDLAGPVVFCILFGFILLLSGKVQFGYIYGIGVIGCLSMYFLLNMMSVAGVSLGVVVSVLGYCLLPMVGLAGANLLLSLQGIIGTILTLFSVVWCSMSASKLFVTALNMQKQQALVAYPCALVYGVFALLAVF